MHKLWALLVFGAVAACAPVQTTFYKPIGPGSYFKNCGGGPDDRLGFKAVEGVGVAVEPDSRATVRGGPRDQLDFVSITFFVGDGHTLQFTSRTFLLSADPPESTVSVAADDLETEQSSAKQRFESVLHGSLIAERFRSRLFEGFQDWQPYRLRLPVTQRTASNFVLRFPAALVDGKPIQIPDVRIEYGTYTHVQMFC